MGRQIQVSLSEDTISTLNTLARSSGKSLSGYVAGLIQSSISDLDTSDIPSEDESQTFNEGTISIRIDGEVGAFVKEKASEYGISNAQFVKNLIKSGGNIYQFEISTQDIGDYMAELNSLITAVTSMIKIVNRTGGNPMKQDAEKMVEYLNEIRVLMRKQLDTSYSNRKQIQRNVEKHIRKEISGKETK